jgi:hypothetical protein
VIKFEFVALGGGLSENKKEEGRRGGSTSFSKHISFLEELLKALPVASQSISQVNPKDLNPTLPIKPKTLILVVMLDPLLLVRLYANTFAYFRSSLGISVHLSFHKQISGSLLRHLRVHILTRKS